MADFVFGFLAFLGITFLNPLICMLWEAVEKPTNGLAAGRANVMFLDTDNKDRVFPLKIWEATLENI